MFVLLKNTAEIFSSCSHVEKHWQLQSIRQLKLLLKVPNLDKQRVIREDKTCTQPNTDSETIGKINGKKLQRSVVLMQLFLTKT